MAKKLLGYRTRRGVQDSTGVNPYLPGTGWDVLFTPDVMGTGLTEVEVFHISLDGPVGSSAAVLLDNQLWDFVNQAWSNGWDPSQPMLLAQTVTVAVCWNVAQTAGPYNRTTNIQPVVTLWLRHEIAEPQRILPGLAY
jgi:hypothetical protein